jgi:hypothetical protein
MVVAPRLQKLSCGRSLPLPTTGCYQMRLQHCTNPLSLFVGSQKTVPRMNQPNSDNFAKNCLVEPLVRPRSAHPREATSTRCAPMRSTPTRCSPQGTCYTLVRCIPVRHMPMMQVCETHASKRHALRGTRPWQPHVRKMGMPVRCITPLRDARL